MKRIESRLIKINVLDYFFLIPLTLSRKGRGDKRLEIDADLACDHVARTAV